MSVRQLVILKSCIGLVIFLGFLYINLVSIDPDLGWHIRVGEWVFENKSVPRVDEYSYTMRGHEWVDHEWLVDAWLWWMYANGLWWVVAGVFTLVVFLPFFFWIRRSRSVFDLWMVFLAAVFMEHLIGVRPQMISFLFFFGTFELLSRRYTAGGTGSFSHSVPLPFIFFVWANLHAGFVAGLGIWGVYATLHYGWRWWRYGEKEYRNAALDLITFVVSAAGTLINPYGIDIYREIGRASSAAETMEYISEWRSVVRANILSFPLFLGVVITLLSAFQIYRKVYPVSLILSALTLLLFLKSVRHGPFFFVVVMPVVWEGMRFLQAEIAAARTIVSFSPKERFRIAWAVGLLFLLSFGSFDWMAYARYVPYPDRAIHFLREEAKKRELPPILNMYAWGGYMIWKAPEIPVFIDGRMPHWVSKEGESAMKEYIQIFYSSDESAWREVSEKREIGLVFLANTAPSPSIKERIRSRLMEYALVRSFFNFLAPHRAFDLEATLEKEGWIVIYEDTISVILLHPSRVN